MADLLMNYEAANTAATSLERSLENLNAVEKEMDQTVGNLEGEWEGVSFERLKTAWAESKGAMQKLESVLSEYAPKIRKVAEELVNVDRGTSF